MVALYMMQTLDIVITSAVLENFFFFFEGVDPWITLTVKNYGGSLHFCTFKLFDVRSIKFIRNIILPINYITFRRIKKILKKFCKNIYLFIVYGGEGFSVPLKMNHWW